MDKSIRVAFDVPTILFTNLPKYSDLEPRAVNRRRAACTGQ
jgi:hypothetical protein